MRKNSVKKAFAFYIAAVFSGLLLFTACSANFFEWINPPFSAIDSMGFFERGNQQFENEDYKGALVSYSNAIVINPKNTRARLAYARTAFWKSLPNFMQLVVSKLSNSQSPDVTIMINILNSAEGRKAIISEGNSEFYNIIINVLESPYGIVNGGGDDVITEENLEANMMLMVAYLSKMLIEILDSNGDNQLATQGDIILLINNKPALAMNINEAMSNMTASVNFSTNNSPIEILHSLQASHDNAESLLEVLKFGSSKLAYFDKIIGTIVRPAKYLKYITRERWELLTKTNFSGNFSNVYESLMDASTNPNTESSFKNYFAFYINVKASLNSFATPINEVHKVMVGTYAFTGSVTEFKKTDWNSHNGGLKAYVTALGAIQNISTNDLNTILANITNTMSPSQISNMLTNFQSMFAGMMGS